MRKNLFSLLLALLAITGIQAVKPVEKLNVLTFNIRMDTESDKENQWKFRKDFAADLIEFYEVDLCGAQEVLHHQLTDLLDRMPGYAYIGVGRADGKTQGEYSPIIYRKDRFTVLNHGDFWLSEDINAVGKKGWDAACERVATWGIFKDKQTGKKFFMLNTHLDHMGKVARHEGAKLVIDKAAELAGKLPIIVTGDFNATPDSEPIQVIVNPNDPRHLTDSRTITALRYGPDWSFHNFGRSPMERRSLIDYIFVKGDFSVLRHGVLTDMKNLLYPSDHCPVLTTLVLP